MAHESLQFGLFAAEAYKSMFGSMTYSQITSTGLSPSEKPPKISCNIQNDASSQNNNNNNSDNNNKINHNNDSTVGSGGSESSEVSSPSNVTASTAIAPTASTAIAPTAPTLQGLALADRSAIQYNVFQKEESKFNITYGVAILCLTVVIIGLLSFGIWRYRRKKYLVPLQDQML